MYFDTRNETLHGLIMVFWHTHIVLAEWDRKANTTPLSRLMICDGLEYTGSNVIKNLPYWKYTQAIVVLNLTESNQWNCCSSLRVSWMLAQVHACTCMQTYMYTYTIQLTCSQGSKLKRVEYYTRIHASPQCHDWVFEILMGGSLPVPDITSYLCNRSGFCWYTELTLYKL